MKNLKLLCIYLLTVCSYKNDNDKPIDNRLKFVGSYKISETEMQYSEYTVTELPNITGINPRIKFKLDNSLNEDELLVDMNEYIQDLYTTYFLALGAALVSVDMNVEKNIIAHISEDKFEINNVEFKVTVTDLDEVGKFVINNKMDIKGVFNESSLKFDFKIDLMLDSGHGIFKGDSKGEKD